MADSGLTNAQDGRGAGMIRILLVLVGIIAVVVIAAQGLFRAAVPVAGKARTVDMKPVEITLKTGADPERKSLPPKIRLPKAYLTNPDTWRGGEHEIVSIETGLPGLEPRPAGRWSTAPAGSHQQDADRQFNADGMALYLSAAFERPSQGFDTPELNAGAAARGFIEQKPVYGLRHAFEIPCAADYAVAQRKTDPAAQGTCRMDRPVQEYFFLMSESGRAEIRMVCTPQWMNETGGCMTDFFHRHLRLKLIFRRAEVQRWQEFIDGARRLVDQIVI